MKLRLHLVFTTLAMLAALTGCGMIRTLFVLVDDPLTTDTAPSTSTAETITTTVSETAPATETAKMATSALTTAAPTETQTETTAAFILYDQLLAKLGAQEQVMRFPYHITHDGMDRTLNHVLQEHPEFFWVKQWVTTTSKSGSWSELKIETEYSAQEIAEMSRQLDAVVQNIISQIPAGADAYEQALFVHDYLVTHTDYDTEAAKNPELLNSTTAYDCLVEHKAVCSGYSSAYQLILQRLGFKCGYCSGMSKGVSHAWNYVEINGAYYWVDVTFDDPVSEDGTKDPDNLNHNYFMLNDELLLRTRSISQENTFVPVCSSLEQNYYVRNGAFLEAYSAESVNAILARESDQHRAEIMFHTADALQEALTALFDNDEIWNFAALRESGCTDLHYQTDRTMNVLIVYY